MMIIPGGAIYVVFADLDIPATACMQAATGLPSNPVWSILAPALCSVPVIATFVSVLVLACLCAQAIDAHML